METDLSAPGPFVDANRGEIQQVLTNLVANAWEALGEERGVISLTVKTVYPAEISTERLPVDWQPGDNRYACLEVRDQGVGISDKDKDKLFDPFFSSKFTGRGLGLPLVLGIVRAHGGAVAVESEPGQGSVFRIFLPLAADEARPLPDRTVEPFAVPQPALGNDDRYQKNRRNSLPTDAPLITPSVIPAAREGSVLLVEDEELLSNMAKAMLTRLGFTVLAAKDGVEALKVFRQHQGSLSLVVCDLTMPGMNGWETLAALRRIRPGIPAILVSGCNEARVMAEVHPESPQAFLGKPYTRKGLSEAISRALGATDLKHHDDGVK
jgi:CheY-like chemotaxis protein